MRGELTQDFAIIGLNAQDSMRLTTAKRAVLYGVGAATIIELYLDHKFTIQGDRLKLEKNILEEADLPVYQALVLEPLFHKDDQVEEDLKWWIINAAKMSEKLMKKVERALGDALAGGHRIEEIASLLGCDLEFRTAGLSMREYRSNEKEYTKQVEGLRSELLEEGILTEETLAMIWLLRESGCLYDIFSKEEMNRVVVKINELYHTDLFVKTLFPIQMQDKLNKIASSLIKKKKELLSTSTGVGVTYAFPFFDRAQSIFIDTEAYAEGAVLRLAEVKARLEENGHHYEVLREGSVPLIKIDNFLYEALPTQKIYKFPVFGVRLRRYQM